MPIRDKASPQFRAARNKPIGDKRILAALGRRIQRSIAIKTPVDTGALRRSSDSEAEINRVVVGYFPLLPRGPRRPNLPQGEAIEFGTPRIKAFRAIRRALAKHRTDITRSFGRATQSWISKNFS